MERIAVIGNVAGGKSYYARRLAERAGLPYFELDRYMLDATFGFLPDADAQHAALVAQDRWVLDGLGRPEGIPLRLRRATAVVLMDLPLWLHYALAAERQAAWLSGKLEHAPGGHPRPRRTRNLFHDMWKFDRELLPALRAACAKAEAAGKTVTRITSWDELQAKLRELGPEGAPGAPPHSDERLLPLNTRRVER